MAKERTTRRGVEENVMAILDSSGVRDACDILDDKLSFLEAVRATSLVSDSSTSSVPTWNMYDAAFRMFDDAEASLELLVACYRLLTDLDLRYPRVYLDGGRELVVVEEAWSPFPVGSDHRQVEGTRNQSAKCHPSSFSILVEEIADAVGSTVRLPSIKLAGQMLLIQYLCRVLQGEFSARQFAFRETGDWVIMRESILNILLSSRRLNFKSFVRNCSRIVIKKRPISEEEMAEAEATFCQSSPDAAALLFAFPELEKRTCTTLQKLLALIMELDTMRKEAELLHLTSRADSTRLSALELLVDELTYEGDRTFPFLVSFSQEPEWKLELVLQYLRRYCPSRPACRTRRKPIETVENESLHDVLVSLLNASNMKSAVKKLAAEELHLLLSHAFQAHLSVNLTQGCGVGRDDEAQSSSCTLKICKNFIAVSENLRKLAEDMVLSTVDKEAIFTATVMISCQ